MADTDGRLADLNLEEARILLDVALRVADGRSLDEQLAILVKLVTEATGAERGTLFVNDPRTNELYSRMSVGGLSREIRLLNHQGIAGHVFQSAEGLLVEDAYSDPVSTQLWISRRAFAPARSPAHRSARCRVP
jgi:GAF domain-containing protein